MKHQGGVAKIIRSSDASPVFEGTEQNNQLPQNMKTDPVTRAI